MCMKDPVLDPEFLQMGFIKIVCLSSEDDAEV